MSTEKGVPESVSVPAHWFSFSADQSAKIAHRKVDTVNTRNIHVEKRERDAGPEYVRYVLQSSGGCFKNMCNFSASCVLDYLLLTLLPHPLALEIMYASSPRPMYARVVRPCRHHSLVSMDRRVLESSSTSLASSRIRSRGGRRAALGGRAGPRTRAVAAERDKAALSPRYPFLGRH